MARVSAHGHGRVRSRRRRGIRGRRLDRLDALAPGAVPGRRAAHAGALPATRPRTGGRCPVRLVAVSRTAAERGRRPPAACSGTTPPGCGSSDGVSRRLTTTRHGMLLADDPTALFRVVASTLACEDEYLAMLSELVAHRLLAGPAVGKALERDVGPVMAAQGWRTGREPVTAGQAGLERPPRALPLAPVRSRSRRRVRAGRAGDRRSRRSRRSRRAGRAAALTFLRARATAPGRRSSIGLE